MSMYLFRVFGKWSCNKHDNMQSANYFPKITLFMLTQDHFVYPVSVYFNLSVVVLFVAQVCWICTVGCSIRGPSQGPIESK